MLYAKSPRAVTAARAGELARRLPPFVTPVCLVVNADAALLTALGEGPLGYYLLVRSEGHPDGAIRGQLHD